MILGQRALDCLAQSLNSEEVSRSSHWQHYLQSFEFKDGEFHHVDGLGTFDGRSSRAVAWLHALFQSPFRWAARDLPALRDTLDCARHVASASGRQLDLDLMRQAMTVAFVDQYGVRPSRALVIGDGYGALTSLLLEYWPSVKVTLINLVPNLMLDLAMIMKVNDTLRVALAIDGEGFREAAGDPDVSVIAVRADDLGLLRNHDFDLALNIASMQEMRPEDIISYFDIIRSSSAKEISFYCCNRENKILPNGTLNSFEDYPWVAGDKILKNEYCPWHNYRYSIWPPKYSRYAGKIIHRLAVMAPITRVSNEII